MLHALRTPTNSGRHDGVCAAGGLPVQLQFSVFQQDKQSLAHHGVAGDFLAEQGFGLFGGHGADQREREAPGHTLQVWPMGGFILGLGCALGMRAGAMLVMGVALLCMTFLPLGVNIMMRSSVLCECYTRGKCSAIATRAILLRTLLR